VTKLPENVSWLLTSFNYASPSMVLAWNEARRSGMLPPDYAMSQPRIEAASSMTQTGRAANFAEGYLKRRTPFYIHELQETVLLLFRLTVPG
jgi:hypothetical protein